MKHTTPPFGPSALPDTDAEFQKYKDARREGYSIMKALIELKFDAGIQDLSECEQVIQEPFGSHHRIGPILIRTTRHCGFNASPTPKRKAGRVLIAAHRGLSGEEARAAPEAPTCNRPRTGRPRALGSPPRVVLCFRLVILLDMSPTPATVAHQTYAGSEVRSTASVELASPPSALLQ